MAHLHGILASRSARAVLLKRGPGRACCTIGWDRQRDTFEVGQWLRQIIEHESCDLSPSGALFAYWVNTNKWNAPNHVYRVVSRAPWLTAAAFWGAEPRGYGPGVALFLDERRVWAASAQKAEKDSLGIAIETELPFELRALPDSKVFFHLRLQRDGWTARTPSGQLPSVHEKEVAHGWALRQTHHVGPSKQNQPISTQAFALLSPSGVVTEQSWEWADADRPRQRVVWTKNGVVSAAAITAKGVGAAEQLFDAGPLRFESRSAPY